MFPLPHPALSSAQSGCVIQTYTEEDHDGAVTLVTEKVDDPVAAPSKGWILENGELVDTASNPAD